MPYSKGRKCSLCGKPIGDYSKTGLCVDCWHEYNRGENASNWRGGLEGKLKRELEKNKGYPHTFNNDAEHIFYEMMVKEGWTVSKRGFPDFACLKANGDEFILVEVKSSAEHELMPIQKLILSNLAKQGITCFHWNPETGFSQVK